MSKHNNQYTVSKLLPLQKPASNYDDWVYVGKETYGSRHVSSRATIKPGTKFYYDRIVYSVLSDIDDDIISALSKADSLTQVIIEEFKRIKSRKILISAFSINCESVSCEDRDTHIINCYEIIFPEKLFIKLSQEKKDQLEEVAKKMACS